MQLAFSPRVAGPEDNDRRPVWRRRGRSDTPTESAASSPEHEAAKEEINRRLDRVELQVAALDAEVEMHRRILRGRGEDV